jgi:hypothetical protein
MKAVRKKQLPPLAVRTARMLRRLREMEGADDHERYLIARSLAATPDERWQFHENFLRSHGLFEHSRRKGYGFK